MKRRRRRSLSTFVLMDVVLAGLLIGGWYLVYGRPAPDVPLPAQIAALPSLTPSPFATYPATLTDLPPTAAAQTTAGATATFGPVVSETPAGGAAPATPTRPPATHSATPSTPATGTTTPAARVPAYVSPAPALTRPPRTNAAPTATATAAPRTATFTAPPPSATPVPPSATLPPTATQPPPALPVSPGGFIGLNGGPVEGNNSIYPYEGNLSHNPTLRNASFGWLARAGVQWYREYASDNINFSWAFVEREPNVFDWTAWDILVTSAQSNGLNLLANIGNGVPPWANGTDNWRQPPSDLYHDPWEETAWYGFVRAMVERYDGDGQADMPGLTRPIKYWEIWNEPELRESYNPPNYPAHQLNANAQDYVRLLATARSAIKAADPSAQVVGPAVAQVLGFGYSPQWTMWDWNSFVAAGGLNYLDIVSFHIYFDRTEWDVDGTIELMLNFVDGNRAGKQVWLTETGWDGDLTSDHADKARNLVRSAVIFWSKPYMDRYFWYSWQESETHEGSDHKGLLQTTSGVPAVGVEPDPLFHPAYQALAVLNRVLAGYGPAERPAAVEVGGAARAYHFNAGGREVWVAWNRQPNGTTSINLDTGGRTLRMIGLYGEDLGTFGGGSLTLGPNPIYLTTDLNWNGNVGRITGRVRSAGLGAVWANGAPGAAVQLSGPVNGQTTTNADGNYLFENLPDGTYTVSVGEQRVQVVVGRELPWGRTSFTLP